MKLRTTICIAAVAALTLPATAGAAVKSYGGEINRGGKIGIRADFMGGDPTYIPSMAFKEFPATCNRSPYHPKIHLDVTGIGPVTDKRFERDYQFGDGGYVFLKGTFKNAARRIEGVVKAKLKKNGGRTCRTKERGYDVKLGGTYPYNGPKVKVHKAFRIP